MFGPVQFIYLVSDGFSGSFHFSKSCLKIFLPKKLRLQRLIMQGLAMGLGPGSVGGDGAAAGSLRSHLLQLHPERAGTSWGVAAKYGVL